MTCVSLSSLVVTTKSKAMKKIQTIASVVFASIILWACAKENSDSGNNKANVVADKSSVSKGESVSFTVQNGAQGALAKWTVTPSTGVVLGRQVSWNQKNSVTFNEPGTYNVQVELRKVWCDSIAALNPGMDTCLNGGTSAGIANATIQVSN
jgi:hypothetical protein